VTHGQCDARPTVTFPAAGHHRPLTGTKLYCLVNRGTCVWTTYPRLLPDNVLGQSRSRDLSVTSLARYVTLPSTKQYYIQLQRQNYSVRIYLPCLFNST